MHGLRHNRDEALPTHSSRLRLLHNSAMLGFWKHLGNLRQRHDLKLAFHLNTNLATLDFLQPQEVKPLVPSVITGAASKKMYKRRVKRV